MTLLELVQDFCGKWNLPVPAAVMASTDSTFITLRALCQEIVRDFCEYKWQQLAIRKQWTSIAGQDQGDLFSIFGTDYEAMPYEVIWDETLRRPIFGPVNDSSWQMLQAFIPGGPIYQYKIMGNRLLINPDMEAGHTLATLYYSNYGVRSNSGMAKPRFTADDDVSPFPDNVFLASLEWRWLKQKEQEWASAYERYADLLNRAILKDASKPVLWLDKPQPQLVPGIWVPAGSWNV